MSLTAMFKPQSSSSTLNTLSRAPAVRQHARHRPASIAHMKATCCMKCHGSIRCGRRFVAAKDSANSGYVVE